MQFFQSIMCLKGLDNRNRFSAIAFSTLIIFLLLANMFNEHFAVSLVILVITSSILTMSTIRRLNDAQLSSNWQYIPGIIFFISGIIILLLNNSLSFWLLLLPALPCTLLLTYPSKHKSKQYIFGYAGPVDLSAYKEAQFNSHSASQRIEPTLAGGNTEQHQQAIDIHSHTSTERLGDINEDANTSQFDLGELIRIKFLQNKSLQKGLLISIMVFIVYVLLDSFLLSSTDEVVSNQPAIDKSTPLNTPKQHLFSSNELEDPLAMPDNFNLYQSRFKGITVHWQADEESNGTLWALATAEGDNSCETISFNKGAPIRTIKVVVENSIDYYAYFSPLDSKELVKALADRGSFSLCGYKFSLKGSQAALGKNNAYANFIN